MKASHTKVIEIYHICLATWWGICLLLPFNTFDYKGYSAMAAIAPEYVWGLFSLVIAIGQFLTFLGKYRRILPVGLAFASFHWFFIASVFIMNDLRLHILSTASGTYLLIAGLILWLSYNIGGEKDGC